MIYFMYNRYREVTGSNALETLNFSGFIESLVPVKILVSKDKANGSNTNDR